MCMYSLLCFVFASCVFVGDSYSYIHAKQPSCIKGCSLQRAWVKKVMKSKVAVMKAMAVMMMIIIAIFDSVEWNSNFN